MFQKLHNKLTYSIFFFILFILLLSFISTFLYSYSVLYNDFSLKTAGLSSRYAKTAALKLKEAENIVSSFVNYKKILEMLQDNSQQYEINNTLNSIRNRSVDILGACILTPDDTVYYSANSYGKDFLKNTLADQYDIYLTAAIDNTAWFIYPSRQEDMHLLCAYPLKEDENILGYLFTDISPAMVDIFDFSDNLFMQHASLILVCGQQQLCLYGDNIPHLTPSSSQTQIIGNKVLTNLPVENTNAQIILQAPLNHFYKQNASILTIMAGLLILFAVICYWSLNKIINQFIANLTALNNEMTGYILEKKGKNT